MPTQEQLNHVIDICHQQGVTSLQRDELNSASIMELLGVSALVVTHIYCPLRFYTPIEGLTFISTDDKMCEATAIYAQTKGWAKAKKIIIAAHNSGSELLTEITNYRQFIIGFYKK